MRLRLRSGRQFFNAIYFSVTPGSVKLQQGEVVDVAFQPQINCYQGERLLQMNVVDIRPSCPVPCGTETIHYRNLLSGCLSAADARIHHSQPGDAVHHLAVSGRPARSSPSRNRPFACAARLSAGRQSPFPWSS